MSKKTKAAAKNTQTPEQVKAAADARIAAQVAMGAGPVVESPAEAAAAKADKPKAKVAPLTVIQRAQLGDKAAIKELEDVEKKFEELTASEKVAAKLGKKAPKPRKNGVGTGLSKIMGHSVTSVLRWMGKQGWSKPEAVYVCSTFGVTPAAGTVQIQTLAGRKGERGDPANLEPGEVKKLNELRKKTPAS